MNQREAFYIHQIQDDFLPYWLQFVDKEHGGILNCINNNGDQRFSDFKFTWSQGRWLWVLSRVYRLAKQGVLDKVDPRALEPLMEGTFRFLADKAVYGPEDICCYLLTREGEKVVDKATNRYDASIYADCFALIGTAQYAKMTSNAQAADLAHRLYRSITKRVENGNYLTEPYPVPDGYQVHSIPMILINTVQEYMDMCRAFGLDVTEPEAYVRSKVRFILDVLYDGTGLIREHISDDASYVRLLNRHITPGHTLEDAWFWLEFLQEYGGLEEDLPRICQIVQRTFLLGWDESYGGLLRFVDREGGKPQGTRIGTPYEDLIVDTWDMKLWWPHSEMLYVFTYLYHLTGDEEFEQMYQKSAQYVFSTFPNQALGEWIQIRQRDGSPQDKLVALPVKDPFHILRNFIKIVELFEKEGT
ncbi:AGE family epimerase/isomerase [uncultured Ruthenibacterium sp.]|uniref:AGE family epimerase/isomerase n=1 Tax=uncultured Ruthenibacterium sp. TaxID=1905347 RepID=UPI00349E5FAA